MHMHIHDGNGDGWTLFDARLPGSLLSQVEEIKDTHRLLYWRKLEYWMNAISMSISTSVSISSQMECGRTGDRRTCHRQMSHLFARRSRCHIEQKVGRGRSTRASVPQRRD